MLKRNFNRLFYEVSKPLNTKVMYEDTQFLYTDEWYNLINTFVVKRGDYEEEILRSKTYIIIDIVNVVTADDANYLRNFVYDKEEVIKCGIYMLIQRAGYPNYHFEVVKASNLILNPYNRLIQEGMYARWQLDKFKLDVHDQISFNKKDYSTYGFMFNNLPHWGRYGTKTTILIGMSTSDVKAINTKTISLHTNFNVKKLNVEYTKNRNRFNFEFNMTKFSTKSFIRTPEEIRVIQNFMNLQNT